MKELEFINEIYLLGSKYGLFPKLGSKLYICLDSGGKVVSGWLRCPINALDSRIKASQ